MKQTTAWKSSMKNYEDMMFLICSKRLGKTRLTKNVTQKNDKITLIG